MNRNGYTLIEISVVIVLIGVIFLMAIPRVQDTVTGDRMRSAVRNLSGTARELKANAVREQVDYFLHLDLDRRVVVEHPGRHDGGDPYSPKEPGPRAAVGCKNRQM